MISKIPEVYRNVIAAVLIILAVDLVSTTGSSSVRYRSATALVNALRDAMGEWDFAIHVQRGFGTGGAVVLGVVFLVASIWIFNVKSQGEEQHDR